MWVVSAPACTRLGPAQGDSRAARRRSSPSGPACPPCAAFPRVGSSRSRPGSRGHTGPGAKIVYQQLPAGSERRTRGGRGGREHLYEQDGARDLRKQPVGERRPVDVHANHRPLDVLDLRRSGENVSARRLTRLKEDRALTTFGVHGASAWNAMSASGAARRYGVSTLPNFLSPDARMASAKQSVVTAMGRCKPVSNKARRVVGERARGRRTGLEVLGETEDVEHALPHVLRVLTDAGKAQLVSAGLRTTDRRTSRASTSDSGPSKLTLSATEGSSAAMRRATIAPRSAPTRCACLIPSCFCEGGREELSSVKARRRGRTHRHDAPCRRQTRTRRRPRRSRP